MKNKVSLREKYFGKKEKQKGLPPNFFDKILIFWACHMKARAHGARCQDDRKAWCQDVKRASLSYSSCPPTLMPSCPPSLNGAMYDFSCTNCILLYDLQVAKHGLLW